MTKGRKDTRPIGIKRKLVFRKWTRKWQQKERNLKESKNRNTSVNREDTEGKEEREEIRRKRR